MEPVPGSATRYVEALVASGRREIAIEQEAKLIKTAAISWLAEPLPTWGVQ
jgi:hypothetical protein